MRIRIQFLLLTLASIAVIPARSASESNDATQRPNADPSSAVLKYVPAVALELRNGDRSKDQRSPQLVRLTKQPHEVEPTVAILYAKKSSNNNPHAGSWIHVYVTHEGRDAMLTGKGVYPEGTIILKQKFHDPAAKTPVVYTGMLKREKGYNPQAGDWEFFVLNGTATRIRESGRLQSCIACHAPFKSTDFVSRRYLTDKEDPE